MPTSFWGPCGSPFGGYGRTQDPPARYLLLAARSPSTHSCDLHNAVGHVPQGAVLQECQALNKPDTGDGRPLLVGVRQQALCARNTLTEAVLKLAVLFALLDVSFDCQANHLRNRLAVDSRNCIQFLCLLSR